MLAFRFDELHLRLFGDAAIMTYRYQIEDTYKGHEVGATCG